MTVAKLLASAMRPLHRRQRARTASIVPSAIDAATKIGRRACLINDDSAPLNAETRAWLTTVVSKLIEPAHAYSGAMAEILADAVTINEFAVKLTNLLDDPATRSDRSGLPAEVRTFAEAFLRDRATNAIAYEDRAFFWPNPTDVSGPRSLYEELPFVSRNKFKRNRRRSSVQEAVSLTR